jgi:hypothetical protein
VTQPLLLVHSIQQNIAQCHLENWLLEDFLAKVASRSRPLLAFAPSNTLELIFVSPAQCQAD